MFHGTENSTEVFIEEAPHHTLEHFRSQNNLNINKLHKFFINVFLCVNPENDLDTKITIVMNDGDLFHIKVKHQAKLFNEIQDTRWFCNYFQKTKIQFVFENEAYWLKEGSRRVCPVSHSCISCKGARYDKL